MDERARRWEASEQARREQRRRDEEEAALPRTNPNPNPNQVRQQAEEKGRAEAASTAAEERVARLVLLTTHHGHTYLVLRLTHLALLTMVGRALTTWLAQCLLWLTTYFLGGRACAQVGGVRAGAARAEAAR